MLSLAASLRMMLPKGSTKATSWAICDRASGLAMMKPSPSSIIVNRFAPSINVTSTRNSYSFFSRNSGEQIWKGLLSVSNAGRRRGRGKGANRKNYKDLNRGQTMGVGERNFLWPGLNAPVTKGSEVVRQKELKADPQYRENILKIRDQMEKKSRVYVHPLERGWTGTKLLGKWIGPPDPIAGEEFVGFDSKVLVVKPIMYMKPNFGRTKKILVLTVTGNGNGLVGYGVAKSKDMRTAISNSKNKAGQRLFHVELEDNHTILHDFYSRFGHTKVFAEKKPPGYGLTAHRCIRSICNVLGITDIKCTIEGSERNYLNVTRAFLLGLINQKSFQQMADEKRLNVVEFNRNLLDYPVVRARPSEGVPCRTDKQIGENEILDFNIYIHDGRVKEPELLKPVFYTKHKGWINYMKKWNYRKSREMVRINLIAKYGSLDSYLTVREKARLQAKRERYEQQQQQQATTGQE